MKFLIIAICVIYALADPHWVTVDPEEVTFVKSTWNEVKKHEVEILYNIFKAYPDIQAKFPMFAGKDLETLKSTTPFALHATRIVSFFGSYITLLGGDKNQPGIKSILNDMGKTHAARGITKEQFNHFRTAFFDYMKAHSTWSDDAFHAWEKAYDKMYYVIFSNIDGKEVE